MKRVRKSAPIATTPAVHEEDFISVEIEDYRGKWVSLCFYPVDFTNV